MKILIFTLYCLIPALLVLGIFLIAVTSLFGLTRLFKIKNASFKKSIKILLLLGLARLFIPVILGVVGITNGSVVNSITTIVLLYFAFYYLIKIYYEKSWLKSAGIYVVLQIVIFVVTFSSVFAIRSYIVSPFQVFGPTMCNTLNYINGVCRDNFGEYLITNKITYKFGLPARGDIIVFRPPHNTQDFYIKRIIGLPGEKVQIQNGKVYIFNKENPDGSELKESYLSENNKDQTYTTSTEAITYDVPPEMYFVLGDNRKKSTDSQTCFRGLGDTICNSPTNHFLPADNIEGKASVVLWPFDNVRWLENPVY